MLATTPHRTVVQRPDQAVGVSTTRRPQTVTAQFYTRPGACPLCRLTSRADPCKHCHQNAEQDSCPEGAAWHWPLCQPLFFPVLSFVSRMLSGWKRAAGDFRDGLVSLSTTSLRSLQIAACIHSSYLFVKCLFVFERERARAGEGQREGDKE